MRLPLARTVALSRRAWTLYAGLGGILAMAAFGVLAPWMERLERSRLGGSSFEPRWSPWLAPLAFGARRALLVGTLSALIGLLVGLPWGSYAGLKPKGILDWMVSAATPLHSLPAFLLFGLLHRIDGPPSLVTLSLVIGFGQSLDNARSLRQRLRANSRTGYVLASYALGASPGYVVRRHLLPNLAALSLERLMSGLSLAVLVDCSVVYLGLIDSPPHGSWGAMIAQGVASPSARHLVLMPSLLLLVTLGSAQLLSHYVRDERNARPGSRAGVAPSSPQAT